MNLFEGVRIALASLRGHKLRTFLTLLGNNPLNGCFALGSLGVDRGQEDIARGKFSSSGQVDSKIVTDDLLQEFVW